MALRVALVHKAFGGGGGTENYCAALARKLVERGVEVHIFTSDMREEIEGVCLHKIPSSGFSHSLSTLVFMHFSAHALRKEEFDIIQGFGKTIYQDIYRAGGGTHKSFMRAARAAYGGWRKSLKVVTEFFEPINWVNMAIESCLYREGRLKAIIAPSPLVKDMIMQDFAVDEGKIYVIPNGVQLERFSYRKRILGDELKILFAAGNPRLKGLGVLLEALALMDKEEYPYHLTVAGRRSRYYLNLARSLGIDEKVEFIGKVLDMPSLYQRADVLVHPTFYDPFSNVCLEALAAGMPVVTTNMNGLAYYMKDGREGFIIEAGDAEALAEAIGKFYTPDTLPQMSVAARELAEKFSFDEHVEKVLNLYRRVADAG